MPDGRMLGAAFFCAAMIGATFVLTDIRRSKYQVADTKQKGLDTLDLRIPLIPLEQRLKEFASQSQAKDDYEMVPVAK